MSLEPLAWCAVALATALLVQGPPANLPHMTSDSCQYVSAAENLRSTHRMETSLVHYDTERSHGTIPSPLTWFPPGYPIAIALTSMVSGGYESAALWISLGSFVLVTAGIWRLARLLDPSRWAARAAVLCWVVNSMALRTSAAALSESLFTLVGLAGLLFLMHTDDSQENTHAGFFWIGAALMAGLSYWVRYAGILWIAAFLAVLVLQTAFRKKRRLPWGFAVAAVMAMVLTAAPLMIRNLLLAGDWRGGNNTTYAMPIREFALTTPKIWYHLALGDAAASRIWLPVALALLGLIGIIVVTLVNGTKPADTRARALPLTRPWILLAVCLIYSAGIAAIALRSVISYIPRMYVPVLPHLIVLSVIGVAFLLRRLPVSGSARWISLAMVACLLLGYGASNAIAYSDFRAPDDFRKTQEALLEPDETGRPMQEHLSRELAGSEVIAASNGQMVGCILKHPTLSLVGHPFSDLTWNEQLLHAEMTRFGAAHLLLWRDADLDPVVQDSPFLTALADGRSVPWLKLVAHNREIDVYRLQ